MANLFDGIGKTLGGLFGGDFGSRAARAQALINGDYDGAARITRAMLQDALDRERFARKPRWETERTDAGYRAAGSYGSSHDEALPGFTAGGDIDEPGDRVTARPQLQRGTATTSVRVGDDIHLVDDISGPRVERGTGFRALRDLSADRRILFRREQRAQGGADRRDGGSEAAAGDGGRGDPPGARSRPGAGDVGANA